MQRVGLCKSGVSGLHQRAKEWREKRVTNPRRNFFDNPTQYAAGSAMADQGWRNGLSVNDIPVPERFDTIASSDIRWLAKSCPQAHLRLGLISPDDCDHSDDIDRNRDSGK